jgi:hypothetical protein
MSGGEPWAADRGQKTACWHAEERKVRVTADVACRFRYLAVHISRRFLVQVAGFSKPPWLLGLLSLAQLEILSSGKDHIPASLLTATPFREQETDG